MPGSPKLRPKLTAVERGVIVDRLTKGVTRAQIARELGRNPATIGQAAREMAPTLEQARRRLEAAADTFAERIAQHADVDQSMEMLDRLAVVTKRRDEGGHGPQVAVFVGDGTAAVMRTPSPERLAQGGRPGQPGLPPAPEPSAS